MSFHDIPVLGVLLCGSAGIGCRNFVTGGDDEDIDEVKRGSDRCLAPAVKDAFSMPKTSTDGLAEDGIGQDPTADAEPPRAKQKNLFFSLESGFDPTPPRRCSTPLWMQQAQRDNEAKSMLSESDSDDNYSYDDDEADREERMSEYERLVSRASTSRPNKENAVTFDVELHDLLTKLGDTAEGSVDECVLRQEFEAMDADGDGSLDVVELAAVFEKLGIHAKPYKLMNLISVADQDGNGTIEWREFSQIVRIGLKWNAMLGDLGPSFSKKCGAVVEYQLKKEFEKIDADGNGSLDRDELQQLFENLDIPCERAMVDQMVVMADKDGNGTIEWGEFLKLFHVISTVSKMTRPRKSVAARKSEHKKPNMRSSCVEWQTIIASVGQQIKNKNVQINDKTLKQEFDRIDRSKDGSLDASELAIMFSDMGISLDSGQISNLVKMADDDGNDTIEWPEFKRMFDISMKWHEFLMKLGKSVTGAGPLNETVLRRQFLAIDKDGSGSLDRDEMKEVFVNLGVKMDDSMLSKLLVLIDGDGSGEIEWPEFKKMFKVVRQLADHHDKTSYRLR